MILPGHKHPAPHGTHARYVHGCRCTDCRAGHAATVRARIARGRAAARELGPAIPGTLCPGVNGAPCKRGRKLRAGSLAVCFDCRGSLVWNGLVDAAPARRHMRKLSRRGVGFRAVAAVTDIGLTTIQKIRNGKRRRIRKAVADRILAVTAAEVSDGALVPAGETNRMLRELVTEYFTRGEVARQLGYKSLALQIGKNGLVLARTEQRVRRLYRRAMGEEAA